MIAAAAAGDLRTLSLALLPGRDQFIDSVLLTGISSPHTRRAYSRAWKKFMSWYESQRPGDLSLEVMLGYRAFLETSGSATSSINQELSALRRMLQIAAAHGFVDRERAASAASVNNTRGLGVRAGNWLTSETTKELLLAPEEGTLKGQRDRALLGVLVGCGLRREELVKMEVADLEMREDRWTIPHLIGKGRRVRLVPVPEWVKERIDLWTANAGIRENRIFRAFNRKGVASESLSVKAVWQIVVHYAKKIELQQPLTPHDLRRTCAKLCRGLGGDLEQIQFLLGHSSVQTTERYLGGEQEIKKAVNDRLFRNTKL